MRKALLPMIASLLLCGSATIALVATNARAAQTARKPVMIAQVTPSELPAQNAPDSQSAPNPQMMREGPPPQILRARRAQFCADLYARKVGQMAFLEVKLELTPPQQPLFDRWKQASLEVAKQRQNACNAPPEDQTMPNHRPSLIDLLNREESRLKMRLSDIQSVRPALEAFYNSLSPEQKTQFRRGAFMMMGQGRMAPYRRRIRLGMAARPSEMRGLPMPGSPAPIAAPAPSGP